MDDAPRVPRMRRCRSKGIDYARVWLRGRWHPLGRWGTDEAHRRYGELVAQHLSAPVEESVSVVTVDRLIVEFMDWARAELADTTDHGGEVTNYRYPLRILGKRCGSMDAALFGLPQMHAVRDAMVARGWTRSSVNRQTGRIRRLFSWGSTRGLVPPEVPQRLQLIEPLRVRSDATSSDRVVPAPLEHVRAAQAKASPAVVAEMIEVLLLTGMRIGELAAMTPVAIDRSGPVWLYELGQHKTVAKVGRRVIPIGPRAREIIEPRIGSPVTSPVFTNTRGRPYEPRAFRKRVLKACEDAGVPQWTTHQLRHTAATLARQHSGLDAARAMLGHSSASMTARYAEADPVALALATAIG